MSYITKVIDCSVPHSKNVISSCAHNDALLEEMTRLEPEGSS